MARLAFCDYHNMIAILEKYKHNQDFHQIVDFVKASHITYALTYNPTVYVSHIREFWSTARVETTEEGTKILATVDGKLRTVSESSIRRNLKLNDEEGISSLPDAELFENLQLMGYNILPNQKFTFQKGQFSHQWKYLIHTIMQCLSPKSTGFNEFSSNIATALGEGSGTPTESHHTPSSEAQQPLPTTHSSTSLPPVTTATIPPVIPTESLPTAIPSANLPLRQYTKRTKINPSSVLPPVVDEPASPLRDDSQGEACPTDSSFEADQDRVNIVKTSTLPSDSTPRVTSLAADEVLEDKDRGVVEQSGDDAPIKGRRLDKGEEAAERVSDDTEEMRLPHTRRKGKETMVESDTPKKKKEYDQFAAELPFERRIELISDLVKYQENYAKVFKYQTQQRKPLTRKHQREFYTSIQDFIPLGSKEEAERFTRKGLRLEQESAKKLKTSEEVPEELKATEEGPEEKVKEMMQLVPVEEIYLEALQVKHSIIDWKVHTEGQRSYWKITRLGGSSASYQFFVDTLKHLDREDLN
uniref:Synaptobrevin, longin-like domain protein n=1 Tax=Tanacetum cinerariifolium TaxID=118510 RepID=A0A6L2LBR8_TANCI|nr:hypothetical protein [Tanacetum cinerariifolium]